MIGTDSHIAVRTAGPANDRIGGGSRAGRWIFAVSLLGCGWMGCSQAQRHKTEECQAPLARPITIAVAPALNHSGSLAFDPVKVADLMASELSTVPGVRVIGVNRVLAILAEQGLDQIQSVQHALELNDRLGSGAILVFAITEYDAYTPVVGLTAQLFGPRPTGPALDPVAASRLARPLPVSREQGAEQLWGQVQRNFNATHQAVQDRLKEYAESRGAIESPYRWRQYLASQQLYLRFCCFTAVRELLEQVKETPGLGAAAGPA